MLLADEPTGNLDEDTRDDIIGLLERVWRERHLTMVMATHDSVARPAPSEPGSCGTGGCPWPLHLRTGALRPGTMRSASTRNYPVGMSGSDRLAAAPRPPLAYRITRRQWLAVDVAAAAAASS